MIEPKGTFAARLRSIMAERGVTLTDMSEGLYGVRRPKTNVSRWMNGTCEPNYASLKAIRETLGCTWDELMGD